MTRMIRMIATPTVRLLSLAVALLGLAAAGCGSGDDVASAAMALSPEGIGTNTIGAVEVLVLDGSGASCTRALAVAEPLDDAGLDVVAHALFTIDGTAKHIQIPSGRTLVFYADAYRSAADRTRIGRGCAEAKLRAGSSSGVTIPITASD
jgi:hypothetical protein